MYQKVVNFIRYNNAFAIAFFLLFSGFGITYAASPEVREGVYASKEVVVSVDNRQVVSVDLDNFNFNLVINSVTEDDKNYYAAYSYQTLAIEDGAWQTVTVEKTLTVSKEALDGKDLGLYATKELAEIINYELSYLKRVQKLEQEKGTSQKVVVTEYSGLVGKLLNPKEEVIEGYNPVIPEPIPEVAPPPGPTLPEPAAVPIENPQTSPQPSPEATAGTAEATSGTAEPTPEPVPPQSEPEPEPTSTSTPPVSEPVATSSQPSPEATAGTAETSQDTAPEPSPTATSTPTIEPEPAPTATSTPASEPEPEPAPTPASEEPAEPAPETDSEPTS